MFKPLILYYAVVGLTPPEAEIKPMPLLGDPLFTTFSQCLIAVEAVVNSMEDPGALVSGGCVQVDGNAEE